MRLPNGGTVTFTCRCAPDAVPEWHPDHGRARDARAAATFETADELNAHAAGCAQHNPEHPDFVPAEVEAELRAWNSMAVTGSGLWVPPRLLDPTVPSDVA